MMSRLATLSEHVCELTQCAVTARTNIHFTILFIFCQCSSNLVICHLSISLRRGNLMQRMLNQQKSQEKPLPQK